MENLSKFNIFQESEDLFNITDKVKAFKFPVVNQTYFSLNLGSLKVNYVFSEIS